MNYINGTDYAIVALNRILGDLNFTEKEKDYIIQSFFNEYESLGNYYTDREEVRVLAGIIFNRYNDEHLEDFKKECDKKYHYLFDMQYKLSC